jgi:tetratricopeptide (TPR) repeat protein
LLVAALAMASVAAGPAAARPEAAGDESGRPSLSGAYLAGRLAGTLRDNAAATTYFKAALRLDSKSPEVVERAFLVMLGQGDIDEAAALGERLVQLDRQHRIARLAIAVRAIKAKQYQVARTQLAQSVRTPIADLTATLLAAWTAYGAGDAKSAVELLDKLQGPDWYATFRDMHAGLILDLAGQKKEAGKRLERAYKADQTALRVVESYARWLSRNGQREEALKVYATFDKAMPKHPLVVDAVETLEKGQSLPSPVRSAQEGAAEVLYGLGSALGRQGGEDLGLIYLQFALYLAPQHPLALLSLADLYETLKKPDLAIDVYERIADKSPLKRNAEIQLGLNLDQLDRSNEAREHLSALVKADPSDLEAVLALGNVLRARKEFADAAKVYTTGIDNLGQPQRRDWMIYYFRGICFERIKEWPKAEADFKKALELYPDQAHVLNYLGYSWIDQGVNLEQGIEMIRRAVQLRPDDGYIVDSLGWAHFKLGSYQEAVAELERAIELKPDDPVINDHLGDAYWKVGRKLEAVFQWSHARDMKPEADDLAKIEVKLKHGLGDESHPAPESTPPAAPKSKAENAKVGEGG